MNDLNPNGEPVINTPSRTLGSRVNPMRIAGGALLGWWRAASLDALIVGVLWFIGLELIHVPFAPLWAFLGAVLQFIPNFGGMLALIGPVLSVAFSGHDEWRLGLVLGLYGLIVVLEGLVIGPYLLHRTTRVPWWAAFLGPIVRVHHPLLGCVAGAAIIGDYFCFSETSAATRLTLEFVARPRQTIERPPHQPIDRHYHQRHHNRRQ